MGRTIYRYRVVSGASAWGGLRRLRDARQAACAMRVNWPEAEVERVLVLPDGGHRYWRWRGGRWSTQNHFDDVAASDLAKWDYAPAVRRIAA